MKTFKFITLHDIRIILGQGQAKDLSRVRMRVYQDDPSQPSARSHTTKHYAEITGNELRWGQDFCFRYQGQRTIAFETYCEHEFGYKLQELQVLYRGEHHLDNDKFFRRDTCPVYSPEGERKGELQWEVRVEKREQNAGEQQSAETARPLVRLDLIALIKIQEMSLETVNPSFNPNKYSALQLRVKHGEQTWSHLGSSGKWKIRQMRVEWVRDGAQTIQFEVASEGKALMSGSAACQTMQKLKRYTKYKVGLSNRSGAKLCNLLLQYRLVQRKQLLDLLYSPQSKLNYDSLPSSSKNQQNPQKRSSPNRQRSFFLPKSKGSRYQIGYLMNRNSDIILPKAPRFPSADKPTPFAYIDPHRCSDFSPATKRGWQMGRSSKLDFTRPFRGNPGVGTYELPSIWSKY